MFYVIFHTCLAFILDIEWEHDKILIRIQHDICYIQMAQYTEIFVWDFSGINVPQNHGCNDGYGTTFFCFRLI